MGGLILLSFFLTSWVVCWVSYYWLLWFLIFSLNSIQFPLGLTLAILHRVCYVLTSLSFISVLFPISPYISYLTQEFHRSVSFNLLMDSLGRMGTSFLSPLFENVSQCGFNYFYVLQFIEALFVPSIWSVLVNASCVFEMKTLCVLKQSSSHNWLNWVCWLYYSNILGLYNPLISERFTMRIKTSSCRSNNSCCMFQCYVGKSAECLLTAPSWWVIP